MKTSRTPLLCAIAVLALYGTGTAFLGTPVKVEDSPAQVVAWLQKHHDDVPVMGMNYMLALIPFLALVAWTRRALPALYGYAFLAAAACFVAQSVIATWLVQGAAIHAYTIDPKTARALLDVSSYYGPMLTTTDIVMAGAVALAVFRESALPRWLGWISAAFVLEQLAETTTVYGTSGFAAPGGAWNLVLGAGFFLVWLLALGVALGTSGKQDATA
jgi:hypothetical protein